MAENKGRSTKNATWWTDTKLELFAEVLADPENNFAVSFEKLTLGNKEVFKHIKNNFEMEMDNEIVQQNNAGQVKANATKLEYTNYGKIMNKGKPSFIQTFLI